MYELITLPSQTCDQMLLDQFRARVHCDFMARLVLTFSLLFFMVIQSIPGSMQAFADHVIEPVLIQTGLASADQVADVHCCDKNNFQEANTCKGDCRLVLLSAIHVPKSVKKNFALVQMTEQVKSQSPPSFRPPIS